MAAKLRFPNDVPNLVDREWKNDADRIVQDSLRDLAQVSQGLGRLPITRKGDLPTFSTDYDRLPLGDDGQVLTVDSTTKTGLAWTDLAGPDADQAILASQIFGF